MVIGKTILTILITISLLGGQHYLSTRKQWWLGGILPVLYTGFATWFKVCKAPEFRLFSLIIVGIVLLGIWADGRNKYKKKIDKEIEKMKSTDL